GNLIVNHGANDLDITGPVSLGGTFTENGGGDVNISGDVASDGNQTYNSAVFLLNDVDLDTNGNTVTFSGAVTVMADLTLGSDNDVVFGSPLNGTAGTANLTVSSTSGSVAFNGAVGAGTGLNSLAVSAGGGIDLNDAITT